MDLQDYTKCLGAFVTGVTVVTFYVPHGIHGFTANSFTSVSLDPPLVLVSVNRKIKSCAYMRDNAFAINILRGNHKDLALHFAGKPQEGIDLQWVEGEYAPYLANALANIQCVPWRAYDGGDHVLYLGEVKQYQYREGDALGFFRGKFQPISSPDS